MEHSEAKLSQYLKNERASWGAFVFWLLGIIGLIAIDQLTKVMAFFSHAFSVLNYFRPIVGKELFLNDKFAFSLPVPIGVIYTVYGAIMIIILLYLARNFFLLPRFSRFAWMLIIAGAVSNIGERLYYGFVKDFIYIGTGVFNVADLYIIVGILLLLFVPTGYELIAKS